MKKMDLKNIKGRAHRNLSVEDLVRFAVKKREGKISRNGALVINTGKYTGRSPHDRFIVKTEGTKNKVDWGSVNIPISEESFEKLYLKMVRYLSNLNDLFVFDGFVGANPKHRHKARIISEFASESLFMRHLMIRPGKNEANNPDTFDPHTKILVAPGCLANPKIHKTNSEAFIILHLEKKIAIIGGTKYCGEIKKAIFSIMNYLHPHDNILPLHSSVNISNKGDSTLFLGLSGTGKTTLSNDPERILVGDDEHGWSEDGLFNFEGGCYAKCIGLEKEKEPRIYDAIRDGAVLENVVMKRNGELDFFDSSLTENTRAAYPMEYVENSELSGVAKHPKTIILLTADAFGVLPPIAKLTKEQTVYHFLSGYTSKLAGTERGVTEPVAVFSKYFGEPFMPLKPEVYASLMEKYLGKYKPDVFLVNTGWSCATGGICQRVPLKYTRKMVKSAIEGKLKKTKCKKDKIFKLQIPKKISGVPSEILDPYDAWNNKDAYLLRAKKLAKEFEDNFRQFKNIPSKIAKSGPESK
jgi:phosphoenolpyruvate carboxykinase (ATP)